MNAPNFLTYQIIERPLNRTCPKVDPSVAEAVAFVPGISDLAMEADCLVIKTQYTKEIMFLDLSDGLLDFRNCLQNGALLTPDPIRMASNKDSQ